MTTLPEEQRNLLTIARAYRRDGYTVAIPASGDSIPAFLHDFRPTLVAERADDHVVVEIKRADRVAGSNDLVALAELVAAMPGWRLELRSVPSNGTITRPNLTIAKDEILSLARKGFVRPAFIVACVTIEMLVAHAAANEGINPANMAFGKLLRETVVRGIVPTEFRVSIEAALERRNRLLHVGSDDPSRQDIDELLDLLTRLHQETGLSAVA